jgi:hypothetical protein
LEDFKICAQYLNTDSIEDACIVAEKLGIAARSSHIWEVSTAAEQNLWTASGVLSALVQRLALANEDLQLQHALVQVLSLAARDAGNSRAIYAAGGVQHLLALLDSTHVHAQQAAASTLNCVFAAVAGSFPELQQRLEAAESAQAALQQELMSVRQQLEQPPEECSSCVAAAAMHASLQQQLQQLQTQLARSEEECSSLQRLLHAEQKQAEEGVAALLLKLRQQQEQGAQHASLQQQCRDAAEHAEQQGQQLQELQQQLQEQRVLSKETQSHLRQQLQAVQEELLREHEAHSCLHKDLRETQDGFLALQLQEQQVASQHELLQQQHEQLEAENAQLLQQLQGQAAAGQSSRLHDNAALSSTAPAVTVDTFEQLWKEAEADRMKLLAQNKQLVEQATFLRAQLDMLQRQQRQQQEDALADQQQHTNPDLQAWARVGDARLLQLLCASKPAESAAVLQELARRVSARTIALAAVRSKAVNSLLPLLAHRSPAVQQCAVFVLHHSIDSTDEAAAQRLCDAGCVKQLVKLLDPSCCAELQEHAAATLARLAACSEQVRHQKLVPPLLKLLRGSSQAVHRCAAAALANVAQDSACNTAICEQDGIQQLVALLNSSSQKVQNAALVALRNLAHYSARSRTAVRLAGGLEFVVKLLSSSDEGVQTNAANAVCALAGGDSPASIANRDEFNARKAGDALQQLQQSSDPEAQDAAENALECLGSCSASGAAAARAWVRSADARRIRDQDCTAGLPRV